MVFLLYHILYFCLLFLIAAPSSFPPEVLHPPSTLLSLEQSFFPSHLSAGFFAHYNKSECQNCELVWPAVWPSHCRAMGKEVIARNLRK